MDDGTPNKDRMDADVRERVARLVPQRWQTRDEVCELLAIGTRAMQKHVRSGDIDRKEGDLGPLYRLRDTPWVRKRLRRAEDARAEPSEPDANESSSDRVIELEAALSESEAARRRTDARAKSSDAERARLSHEREAVQIKLAELRGTFTKIEALASEREVELEHASEARRVAIAEAAGAKAALAESHERLTQSDRERLEWQTRADRHAEEATAARAELAAVSRALVLAERDRDHWKREAETWRRIAEQPRSLWGYIKRALARITGQ